MNSPQPAPGLANQDLAVQGLPAQPRNWARRLVVVLVALVVIAVAGATFVFSYAGVHAIALLGGMSTQLARYYPALFDAVLVIACVAAVVLRDGRWWARLWAWLVIVVLLAAIGAADVVHAANYTLRHRTTEGIVAAAPVVAVLLAFSLLLSLLRKSRPPAPAAPAPAPLDVPALPAAVPAPPIALPAAPATNEAPVVPAPPVVGVPAAEPQAAPAPPTAPVPVAAAAPAAPLPVTAPLTEAVPGPEDSPVLEGEPTQPVPVITDVPEPAADASRATESPQDGVVPQEMSSPTEPNEVVPAAEAEEDEPAPPTVEVPTVPPRSQGPTVSSRSPGIRYASRTPRNTPKPPDYWDTGQLAGVVYRAREDDDGDDAPAGKPAPRPSLPELDDDTPPFATIPFASAPRLNRVRSMPAPPADDEDEDE